MPVRKTPIVTDEIYHICGRGVARQPIFKGIKEYSRFLELIDYYRFLKPSVRFSYYVRFDQKSRDNFIKNLHESGKQQVLIYSFSLMPNHYHILAKQIIDNGIVNFIRLLQNSYAKYINDKTNRIGSLFQNSFKAIRIENDEQFLHTSRYIHLNPLTSFVIKNPADLESYPWNSFIDYVGEKPRPFVNTEMLMSFFRGDKNKLREFTMDQLDFQRKLDAMKHLALD